MMAVHIRNVPLRTAVEPVESVLTIKQDNPVELMRFSDNRDYIVKFKSAPANSPQKLYRDYIGGMLAHSLGLPVPPFGLIYIDQSWIDEFIKPQQPKCLGGHQFMSRYIWGVSPVPKKKYVPISKLTNPEAFVHMFVFDLWVGNQDRKRDHVLLRPLSSSKKHRIYLIDHGGTLKPRSKVVYRMTHRQGMIQAYRTAMKLIDGGEPWLPFAKKIMSISDKTLEKLYDTIPEDWNINKEMRQADLEFLLDGRKLLLEWVRGAQEEWRGTMKKNKKKKLK